MKTVVYMGHYVRLTLVEGKLTGIYLVDGMKLSKVELQDVLSL